MLDKCAYARIVSRELMKNQIASVQAEALARIAGIADMKALEDARVGILGKKGSLTQVQQGMRDVPKEDKPAVGALLNEARALITQDFGDTTESVKVALGASGMYEVTGADTSGTGFELGVGFSIPVEQHTTLYADADMTMAPDYTGFRGNIGVRYDF